MIAQVFVIRARTTIFGIRLGAPIMCIYVSVILVVGLIRGEDDKTSKAV